MVKNPFDNPKTVPVIIGSCGGLNPAGRSGNLSSYAMIIRDVLDAKTRAHLVAHQLRLMNLAQKTDQGWKNDQGEIFTESDLVAKYDSKINDLCFIRKPQGPVYFDPYEVPSHRKITLEVGEVMWPRKYLPQPLPEGFCVTGEDPEKRTVRIQISKETEIFIPQTQTLEVSCAGMIPEGVDLSSSGFGTKGEKIPHNIKLALFGANDAMKSLGVAFEEISRHIPQNQIGLYIGSAMSQLDHQGLAGYIQGLYLDNRIASTSVPFSLNNMAADFIAAYVLGSLGHISCDVGACATFLYNLYNATRDIRLGKIQFALVGASDAPIKPWVYAAYNAMKALVRDDSLRLAKKVTEKTGANGEIIEELLRSGGSIPFGENFGFTMSEGCQFLTLFHPDAAQKLGINPLGAVGEVFCHSDGWKSSISKPGIGNYLSFGRALGALQRDLGTKRMRKKTYVSAHGSSTPQNRQTESKMFDRFAEAFGFENLMVTAPKSWLGHTLGAASGDQILGALGSFEYQVISNIRNLDKIPEDVSRNHLRFLQDHHSIKESGMDCCVVNSKGFGGHNATALIYSPQLTKDYMHHKFSPSEQKDFEKNSEKNQKNREKWEEEYLRGAPMIEYNSTHPYDEDHIVDLGPEGMKIKGLEPKIKF